ncbi:heterokaryon incompatibility protein-domain-containing protein [Lophiotrema nucula]|uniref:Heterokaryon incompatibility protein-domain-containing protein n=1 Tax=Lophiotrema nucula TaxID=690887 RepID=A0A6A5ZHB7_9PLEO|nr:heterokaryon incompatibility protein-domain-containing protein [Lophiotrema nucula]
MERDDERTFGEIYRTKDELVKAVEEIIDLAIVEVSDNEPLQLRFLTPLQLTDNWDSNGACHDFKLTSPNDHAPGMEYITVSYCWKHEQSTSGLSPVPKYRIWDPTSSKEESRPIRCPELVFHRAWQFAQRRNCPYLWIDQECIDQEDAADVEKHLQIMDRVYSASRYTVAPLSIGPSSFKQLVCLVKLHGTLTSPQYPWSDHVTGAVDALGIISSDRWFWRTWAFQEKHCSRTLYLLIPTNPGWEIDGDFEVDGFKPVVIGNDVCFNMLWLHIVIKSDPCSQQLGCKENWIGSGTYELHQTQKTLITHFIQSDRNALWRLSRSTLMNERYRDMYRMMDRSSNLKTADRLSIYANACHLDYRVLSNRLDKPQFSYSTCFLALLLAHIHPNGDQRRKRISDHWDELSQVTFKGFLEAISDIKYSGLLMLSRPSTISKRADKA